MSIEVFRASDGYRWRLVGGNGEIMAQSERYASYGNAARAARRLAAGFIPPLTVTAHPRS